MALVQYNPSTGLASYNAVTGKAQVPVVGEECSACIGQGVPTPYKLRVTLSNLVPVCTLNAFGSHRWIGDNVSGTLNRTVELTNYVPGINPPCYWRGHYYPPLGAMILTTHPSSSSPPNCDVPESVVRADVIRVDYTASAWGDFWLDVYTEYRTTPTPTGSDIIIQTWYNDTQDEEICYDSPVSLDSSHEQVPCYDYPNNSKPICGGNVIIEAI